MTLDGLGIIAHLTGLIRTRFISTPDTLNSKIQVFLHQLLNPAKSCSKKSFGPCEDLVVENQCAQANNSKN